MYVSGCISQLKRVFPICHFATFGGQSGSVSAAAMEALRTKVDSLQWEVNRLEVENRRLRASDGEASERLDLESKVQQMTGELEACRERLEESDRRALRAEERVSDVEQQLSARAQAEVGAGEESVPELSKQLEEVRRELLQAESRAALALQEVGEVRCEKERAEQQKEIVEEDKERIREGALRMEEELEGLEARCNQEKEDLRRDAELVRYRSLEAEQRKWEAREGRLVEQIDSLKANHRLGSDSDCLKQKLQLVEHELACSRSRVTELEGANECNQILIERLRAELRSRSSVGVPGLLRGGTATWSPPACSVTMGATSSGVEGGPFPMLRPCGGVQTGVGYSWTPVLPTNVPGVIPMASPSVNQPLSVSCHGAPPVEVSRQPVQTLVGGVLSAGRRLESIAEVRVDPVPTASLAPDGLSRPGVGVSLSSLSGPTMAAVPAPVSQSQPSSIPATICPGPLLSSASLLSQLPQIPRFHGEEQQDGESFQDWLEQFEAISELGRWDSHCKLVNLTTRLKGTAYSFYRSLALEKRSSYSLLVAELKKRFTPVRLTAIQSQVFHGRQQGPKESVDEYAQELRKLFAKAYSSIARGGPEAESLGQSVLANQFIAGLRADLKAKVVGTEGDLDQLLAKARFEEAKRRELDATKGNSSSKKPPPGGTQGSAPKGEQCSLEKSSPKKPFVPLASRTCFNCGMSGHLSRDCSYSRPQKGDKEAKGKKGASVASVTTAGDPQDTGESTVVKLRRQLQEAELAEAAQQAAATIHGVTSEAGAERGRLGPTLMVDVSVNGKTTKALVDTGSPVTIVSLKFIMEVLLQERSKFKTAEEWNQAILLRFEPPAVTLKSYGGGRLNVVGQIGVTLQRGSHSTDALVLVQKDAPCELLLGTDVQLLLGISVLLEQQKEGITSLLGGGTLIQRSHHESGVANDGTMDPRVSGGGRTIVDDVPTSWQDEGEPDELRGVNQGVKQVGVVRLLEATRVPALHKKLVRVRASGWKHKDQSLLTPTCEDPLLGMADAIVQFEEGTCATVVVENRSNSPMKLKKGMTLGRLELVDSVVESEERAREQANKGDVGRVCVGTPNLEEDKRMECLKEQLKFDQDHLTEAEKEQLEELITEYADVFAVSSDELGTTNLVTHVIDTGDHCPIRQPVRWTPFALRDQIAQMVKEMQERGIIQPSQSPWASPVVLVMVECASVLITDNSIDLPGWMFSPFLGLTTHWNCCQGHGTLQLWTWHRATGKLPWILHHRRKRHLSRTLASTSSLRCRLDW